jgi:hypothetical protein
MSKARLVLTALLVDRQTPAEVAARYGVRRLPLSRQQREAKVGDKGVTCLRSPMPCPAPCWVLLPPCS